MQNSEREAFRRLDLPLAISKQTAREHGVRSVLGLCRRRAAHGRVVRRPRGARGCGEEAQEQWLAPLLWGFPRPIAELDRRAVRWRVRVRMKHDERLRLIHPQWVVWCDCYGELAFAPLEARACRSAFRGPLDLELYLVLSISSLAFDVVGCTNRDGYSFTCYFDLGAAARGYLSPRRTRLDLRCRGLSLDLGCGWLHSADRNPWTCIAGSRRGGCRTATWVSRRPSRPQPDGLSPPGASG
jgi:hypothetical protein